jgi:hypothetical protein
VRLPRLRDRVAAATASGDMRRVVDDLTRAFSSGRFAAGSVLFNFISDLAKNMNAKSAEGNRLELLGYLCLELELCTHDFVLLQGSGKCKCFVSSLIHLHCAHLHLLVLKQ